MNEDVPKQQLSEKVTDVPSAKPSKTLEDDIGLLGTVFFIIGAILLVCMSTAIQGIGAGMIVASFCFWVGAFGKRRGWRYCPRAPVMVGFLLGGSLAALGIVQERLRLETMKAATHRSR